VFLNGYNDKPGGKISMKRTIFFILFMSVASHICSQTEYVPLSPVVILPEKSEFKTWEDLTRYTKTYVVDRKHPDASDSDTGDEDHPFLTINKAAQADHWDEA
jgi:hypothetical protein